MVSFFLSFFFVPLVVSSDHTVLGSNVTLNYIFLLLLLAHFISVVAVAAALVPDCCCCPCCNICWITRARFDLAFCSCLLFFALSSIASPEGNYVPRRKHMQAHTHTHTPLSKYKWNERVRKKKEKEKRKNPFSCHPQTVCVPLVFHSLSFLLSFLSFFVCTLICTLHCFCLSTFDCCCCCYFWLMSLQLDFLLLFAVVSTKSYNIACNHQSQKGGKRKKKNGNNFSANLKKVAVDFWAARCLVLLLPNKVGDLSLCVKSLMKVHFKRELLLLLLTWTLVKNVRHRCFEWFCVFQWSGASSTEDWNNNNRKKWRKWSTSTTLMCVCTVLSTFEQFA